MNIPEKKTPFKEIWDVGYECETGPYVQRKGKFDYLSWQSSYRLAIEVFGDIEYEDLPDEIHHDDTVTVRVKITIEGHSRHMWLPVLDYANNCISKPSAADISDSRQRCRVKCLSLFGLGFHVYEGKPQPEDMLVGTKEKTISVEQQKTLNNLAVKMNREEKADFKNIFKITEIADLPASQFKRAEGLLEERVK